MLFEKSLSWVLCGSEISAFKSDCIYSILKDWWSVLFSQDLCELD